MSELLIPEPRDGFFGYNEEKSLQHVCCLLLVSISVIHAALNNQIEEKLYAQRRSSDVDRVIEVTGVFV